jgi:hypothetical protein
VFSVASYSIAILFISIANLALAAIAYLQRAKQIRGNRLREHQLQLAERRNHLAENRLRRLDDQLLLLAEIRDALCVGTAHSFSATTTVSVTGDPIDDEQDQCSGDDREPDRARDAVSANC